MSTGNSPVIPLPNPYPTGLSVRYVSATQVIIDSGKCWDSTSTFNMTVDSSITVNAQAHGVNGLDQGALANNTLYHIHLISSSLNSIKMAAILSTSASSPLMPAGYDLNKIVGFVATDGSGNFIKFYSVGKGTARKYYYDTIINVVNASTASGVNDVTLQSCVPAINNTLIMLNPSITPSGGSGNNYLQFLAPGSFSFGIGAIAFSPTLVGQIGNVLGSGIYWSMSRLINGVAAMRFYYATQGGGLGPMSINVIGFEFTV